MYIVYMRICNALYAGYIQYYMYMYMYIHMHLLNIACPLRALIRLLCFVLLCIHAHSWEHIHVHMYAHVHV